MKNQHDYLDPQDELSALAKIDSVELAVTWQNSMPFTAEIQQPVIDPTLDLSWANELRG